MTKMHLGLIVALIVLLCFVPMVGAHSWSGAGTGGDPYQITTYAQFNETRDAMNKCYKLMNDIDAEGATFSPYTAAATGVPYFINGDNHALMNMKMGNASNNNRLMFANGFNAGGGNVVKNLILYNVSSIATSTDGQIGFLVGNTFQQSGIPVNIFFDRVKMDYPQSGGSGVYMGSLVASNYGNDVISNIGMYASNITSLRAMTMAPISGRSEGQSNRLYTYMYSNASTTFSSGGQSLIGTAVAGTIFSSFFDRNYSNVAGSVGTSKYSYQMINATTYINWDPSVWMMSNVSSTWSGYPVFVSNSTQYFYGSGRTGSLVPSFTYSKISGQSTSPIAYQFTGSVSGDTPLTYLWDFGDLQTANNTEQSPIHAYALPGVYTVKFSTANYDIFNTTTQIIAITPTWNGAGTVGDPYQITSCGELEQMDYSLGSYYKVMNNIDCSAYTYTRWLSGHNHGFRPVGWNGGTEQSRIANNTYRSFTGTLDGDNKIITGLYFNQSVANSGEYMTANNIGYVGLFAGLSGATVKNMVLLNWSMNPTEPGDGIASIGTIAGLSTSSTISKVSVFGGKVLGNKAGNNFYSGGIIGQTATGITVILDSVVNMTCIGGSGTGLCSGTPYGMAGTFIGNAGGTMRLNNTLSATPLRGINNTGYTKILVGGTVDPTSTNNTFWDNSTYSTGLLYVTTQKFTNLTNAQAKSKSSYTGWDFINVWNMSNPSSVYGGYPYYRWLGEDYVPTPPIASFTKSATSGTVPLTVTFTDTSTNTPTSWLYVFGDGSSTNATVQSPIHTFTSVGTYNVNLTATNADGSNTSATQEITVNPPAPVAAFTMTDSASYVYPLRTQFNDTSTNTPTSWQWTFGDGRTSTLQNPHYSYTVAGNYTVTLNATNVGGSNTVTHYVNLYADDDIYLMSWLHFNTTPLIDLKGNAWSLHGATVSATQSQWGGTSLYLSTNNNYASSPSSNKYDFGSGDFDLSFWIYPVSLDGEQNLVSRTTLLGAGEASGWAFNNNGTVDGYSFWMGSLANASPHFSLTSNAWHHIVITRVSGTIEIFRDGVMVSTKSQPGNYDTGNSVVFGASEPGGEDAFYLDEFRITAGYPRFTTNFDTPYAEYRGNLIASYVNIQPDATLRYKTDPGTPNYPQIFNYTPRYRTVQIQNVVNATRINVSVFYSPNIMLPTGVQLNTTDFNDIILDYYEIDPAEGVVRFSVSKAAGIKGTGAQRVNLVDIPMVYYGYSPEPYVDTYFVYGLITDGEHGVSYPILYFIDTPVYLVWVPMSNFTVSNTAPRVSVDTVNFVSELNQTANRFEWNFGDGNTTTTNTGDVTHIYATTGLKSVSLRAYLSQNTSVTNTTTRTDVINVGDAPTPSFTKDHTTGTAPLTVHFTDTSTNSPTEWFWVFGDGDTTNNTQQNPVHTFVWANTYNVYMKANNSYGWSDYSAQQSIEVGSPPIASYSRVPWSGDAPLTVVFNDTSYPYATSWDWNFGDGTHAYTKNATHVYNNAGDFDTNLTATNSYGSELTSNYNIIVDMNASFVGAPVSGDEPLVVAFSSAATTGNPTSWLWDFGDNTTSTLQNPSHTYSHGTYSVSLLTYRAGAATAGFARSGYITANLIKPTDASWTANITSGTLAVTGHAPGRQVKFTSHSLNGTPDTFHWIIDGTYSTTEEPIVTLYDPGTIKVNVSVLNSGGSSNWYCSTYTTIGMAPSIINATVLGVPSGMAIPPTGGVAFGAGYNYLLGGDPLNFTWNFGDGTIKTNPSAGLSMYPQYEVHSFTTSGTFDVILTLTNVWGVNHTHFSYVVLTAPPQTTSITKWVNTKGETITSAYSTENVSFSFDTVNTLAINPPVGYYQDDVEIQYFKQDPNTLNWILISPYPYFARRPLSEPGYTPRSATYQMPTTGGNRWTGYTDNVLTAGKYRAQLLANNETSHVTYPSVVLSYSDITITDNPILVSNVGEWANDVGGTGLKLIIMAIIMLILIGIPYLITRQFNIYLEVVMAVIAIGLSYFMGLIDLWVIFGLIVLAVASVFFIGRGGGGGAEPASSGGEIG